MALYTDLPGVELTIKDGNLVLPVEPAGTERVLIIAPISASGAAVPETIAVTPVRVKGSEDFATYNLGTFDKNNVLARKWKQVYDAGCKDIYVIELFGTTDEEKYNYLTKIYEVIGDFDADIVLLDGVKVDSAISDVETSDLLDMTDALDTDKKVYKITGDIYGVPTVIKTVGEVDTTLVAGTGYTFDYATREVTLKDALVADDEIEISYDVFAFNYAKQLADFCEATTIENRQVIGVMSVEPAASKSLTGIKAFVDGQPMAEYNQFLQIVCGPTMMFEMNNHPYEDDFSGAYAGLISILPSYSSTTNKVAQGALWQSYALSPTQIRDLVNKHYVVPRVRNGRIVITDGITTAPDASDFVRLSTVRIVNDAVNLVREICEPYIGEPNTLARRNALETQIDSALKGMIRRGALNDYRFSVKASLADQLDGNLRVALDLVPVFEIRRIFITVAVKPSL